MYLITNAGWFCTLSLMLQVKCEWFYLSVGIRASVCLQMLLQTGRRYQTQLKRIRYFMLDIAEHCLDHVESRTPSNHQVSMEDL